ncbi:hypothetical protein GJ496_002106 [Pomphorhynchus laevis]|nr:hypothetical protein GJ496_002106 [Pomphorhynchus laevis]
MAFNPELSRIWSLEKYARNDGQDWNVMDCNDFALSLMITPTLHLVITSNGAVEECINLWNAQQRVKGIFIKESLMISYKGNRKSYRLRMKFAQQNGQNCEEICFDCVGRLRVYFNIRNFDNNEGCSENFLQANHNEVDKTQDVIESLISKERHNLLPAALNENDEDIQQIDTFLSICLVDPEFPDFVDKIETILRKIIQILQEIKEINQNYRRIQKANIQYLNTLMDEQVNDEEFDQILKSMSISEFRNFLSDYVFSFYEHCFHWILYIMKLIPTANFSTVKYCSLPIKMCTALMCKNRIDSFLAPLKLALSSGMLIKAIALVMKKNDTDDRNCELSSLIENVEFRHQELFRYVFRLTPIHHFYNDTEIPKRSILISEIQRSSREILSALYFYNPPIDVALLNSDHFHMELEILANERQIFFECNDGQWLLKRSDADDHLNYRTVPIQDSCSSHIAASAYIQLTSEDLSESKMLRESSTASSSQLSCPTEKDVELERALKLVEEDWVLKSDDDLF